MQYRVEFTRRAIRDLDLLYLNIHAAEFPAPARWFNGLEEIIDHLHATPLLGFPTHEDPAVRQLVYGNKPHLYRVLYEVNDATHLVTILSIRHGRRREFK